MKKIIYIILLSFTGCSTVAYLGTDNSESANLPVSNFSDIKVYIMENQVSSEFDVLGEVVVAADGGSDAKLVIQKLKTQASKLGADAIVNLRIEYEYGYISIALKATGTAIKMKE